MTAPTPGPVTGPETNPETELAPSSRPRMTARTTVRLPHPLSLGLSGTILLSVASYSSGATALSSGVLASWGLDFIAYGHGRNLGMVAYWLALMLLVGAWVLAGKQLIAPTLRHPADARHAQLATEQLSRWLGLWLVPLLWAGPIASRDIYSYLAQGALVGAGFDPYTTGAVANPGPLLWEVSYDWRTTTTPYGPLHLWLASGVVRLVGENIAAGIFLYKLLSLAGMAVLIWAVPRCARLLGTNPALALWLAVANPVMIIHLVGGMHNEALMVALCALGLVAALRGRALWALLAVALAAAIKITALILTPFIVWILLHHYTAQRPETSRRDKVGYWLALAAGTALIHLAVFAAISYAAGLSWGWITEITGNSKVINPLAAPTLIADLIHPWLSLVWPTVSYNLILAQLRSVAAIVMLAGLVLIWWRSRHDTPGAVAGSAAAYGLAFIANSVTLPWYYASVLLSLGLSRMPLWLLQLATGASIVIALSFAGDGNHQLYTWWWMLGLSATAWAGTSWIFSPAVSATPPSPAPGE